MESLTIRPYARLLTMLGDQLIKNEIVALTELVKNSYDADAALCNVKFDGFDESYGNAHNASITIEDDGYGMSYDIITKHFLNPATPIKKKGKELRKSKKGRICQGEKGIGRFSMLKLGRNVTILSKEKESLSVHKVTFNFDKYDDDFLTELEKEKEIFLDQIEISYETAKASDYSGLLLDKQGSGTAIIIKSLKGKWDTRKVNDFKDYMLRFNPFELDGDNITSNKDFTIEIYRNKVLQNFKDNRLLELKDIIFHKALYKVSGNYCENEKKLNINYLENGKANSLDIYLDPNIDGNVQTQYFRGLKVYRGNIQKGKIGIANYFENEKATECGDFEFKFYVFNFGANQHEQYGLSDTEKDIVKSHRVFLYRDDVRVQPYGAPDDDWLELDRYRAEDKAGDSFSNNQLIGQIKITKQFNKNLRDKTSREGIIEDSQAFKQLILLVRGILTYMRTKPYQNFIAGEEKKKELNQVAALKITNDFSELQTALQDNKKGLSKLKELQNKFEYREKVYKGRINTAEQLAGVGLSVEVASHDIMLTIDRLKDNIHQTKVDTSSTMLFDLNKVHKNCIEAESMIGLVYMKMKDIQQLFVSSKQRPKLIPVIDIIKKIESIYAAQYKNNQIKVEYEISGSPVKAKVVDAVLYQVFINLFDNSLYWIQQTRKDRTVKIKLDGDTQSVIFADNGPGISDDDAPYVFDAFYSGKGEDGRGLGLYIAKKLLNKSNYDIEIVLNERTKELSGANFLVSFVTKESDNAE